MSIFQKALCGLIRLYQKFISPGLGRNCRFSPSCSQYGIEAIRTHGCVKGLLLTAWRIARCNPLGLRPRTGKGPLEKSGPASLGLGSVFHQTRKISGKPLRRCSLEER